MLFAKGKRPDRLAVRAFAGRQPSVTVSHDPVPENAAGSEPDGVRWVELLSEGLTFDPGHNPHWAPAGGAAFDGFQEPTSRRILRHLELSARLHPWAPPKGEAWSD